MIREITATGRDVNEAIEQGCAQLGIDRDDAQFEIISLPKKSFLGLKKYPAKVRVYQELPDPKPAPARPAPPAPRAAAPAPIRQQNVQPPRPKPPQQPARPQWDRPQSPRPAAPRPMEPRPEHRTENQAVEPESAPKQEIVPTNEVRSKVEKAAVYLAEIMHAMGFEGVEVTPAYYEETVCLRLSGAQMGVVIGRRGETLDALQYLTSLVANRGEGDYIRVNIDSGNYREKREKTLTALARKLALQVVRSGKSTTLEPMNPYERRVIHGAVSQIRGADSTSIGTDPNRRVVISCADPAKVRGTAPRPVDGDRGRGPRDAGHGPHPSLAARGPRPDRPPLRPNLNVAPGNRRPDRADHREAELVEGQHTAPYSDTAPLLSPAAAFAAQQARAAQAQEGQPNPGVPRHLDDAYTADLAAAPATPQIHLFNPVVPTVRRVDDGTQGNTATFAASTPAAPQKLKDAELFADIPIGVPIVSGDHPGAPRPQAQRPEPRAPKKIEGEGTPGRYGKV